MTPKTLRSASAHGARTLTLAGVAFAGYLFAAFSGCSSSDDGGIPGRNTSGTGTAATGSSGSGSGTSGTATGGQTTGGTQTGTASGGTPTGTGTATGTSAGATGTTATGAGGGASTGPAGSTGPTGTGGAGGAGSGGAGGGNAAGCVGVTLPAGNRCGGVAQPTIAAGGQMLIDDFTAAAGDTATCHKIAAVDGRVGSWNSGKDVAAPTGTVVHTFEAAGAGGPASGRAVHIVGQNLNAHPALPAGDGKPTWGGYLAVPLAPCYNASKYQGLSFWLKGDPTKAKWVKISFVTPQTAEGIEGGSCVQGTGIGSECYDHFSVELFKVSSVWTRYAITWQQLAQFGWGKPVAATYRPETEIIGINFAPVWNDGNEPALDIMPNKGFDFWVGTLSFDVAGPFTDTGLKQTIDQQTFNAQFPTPAPVYGNPYTQLAAVLEDPRFSRIGREGSANERKQEIAAMMAHITQETGNGGAAGSGLINIDELNPPQIYCQAGTPWPCAPGQSYHGRGALQLSWNYNYGQLADWYGLGTQLLSNPGMVGTDSTLIWRGSMFFWLAWKDPIKNQLFVGPHTRFMATGFGGTIRAINGGLECGAGNAAADNRRRLYQQYCTLVKATGCDQLLVCPPS